jgi:hypothetical protein
MICTHVFDVRTRVDGDDVPMLDSEIMSNSTVYPRATIIQIVIGQNDQYSVLSLFSLDQDCVATE